MSVLDEAAVQKFLAEDDGGPVVMLNLVKFEPDGGEAKYLSYLEKFETSGVKERYNVEVVYGGAGSAPLAADGRIWDMVALVRYPSRRHFAEMIVDPDYVAFEHLRSEAVVAAVLQPTTPVL
ncbi:hypothetical protein BVC93_13480 [Mycobacterium sp. MS1601]|uniref:hypothetical protein n=1 Tax=Mycobacterium sp. MS1601 TaxID=1936029 RepID=UPI0009794B95|nr:hypothetical protein [Mycobacterium sp. MS1601]AQA03262.1 hypothetical protein BVC93_13480 [Mycobacterium sp. MS1601]